MRTIFLHIGSEKTGTTSIQQSFSRNKHILLSNNLVTPSSSSYLFSVRDLYPLPFLPINYDHSSPHQTSFIHSSDNLLCEFQRFFVMSKKLNVILSSEHFHSKLFRPEHLYELRAFLLKYFDRIVPILYIRNPLSKVSSLLSEGIKSGFCTLDESEIFSEYFFNSCSTRYSPALWKKFFPDMILKDYDLISSSPSGLIEDFYTTLCPTVSLCDVSFEVGRLNTRLSFYSLILLSLINKLLCTNGRSFSYKNYIPIYLSSFLSRVECFMPSRNDDKMLRFELSHKWLTSLNVWDDRMLADLHLFEV
jgi:hypothetical protein